MFAVNDDLVVVGINVVLIIILGCCNVGFG
jgi:hypothetical protein